jgi:hypothetical protein
MWIDDKPKEGLFGTVFGEARSKLPILATLKDVLSLTKM